MSLIWADRVAETSTTTGTGALTLAGALTGYRAFSAVCATNDIAHYAIEAVDSNGLPTGDWETGIGTYSGANTLTRTTILASSNAGSAVNLASGTKRVMLCVTASDAVGGTISARYWRQRLVSPITGHLSDGMGLCLVDWRNSGGTLIGSGTPIFSYEDSGGGFFASEAFNGSSASGNGWYSGSNTAMMSWLGYDFGSTVTPTEIRSAPLTGFLWSIGLVQAIDYSTDGVIWKNLCMTEMTAGATGVTQDRTIQ